MYGLVGGKLASKDGWDVGKILWIVDPAARVSRTISVTGRRIPDGRAVLWQTDIGTTKGTDRLVWDPVSDLGGGKWMGHASAVIVKEPGCFEFTVTGPAVPQKIVVALT